MSPYCKNLNALSQEDFLYSGGKGISLGKLLKSGIQVPPGYIILSTAFDNFLESSNLKNKIKTILNTVDVQTTHTIDEASEKIQNLILGESEFPKEIERGAYGSFKDLDTDFVAVRSSATAEDGMEAAWAGQLDTFLNTTEKTLLDNVRRCWASLYTSRAIFYRFMNGMQNEEISVAVIVQKMVNSKTAGVAFSAHPVTEDRNQIVIEAAFGLGEAVVSGQVTPDTYIISKDRREIQKKNIAKQNKSLVKKEQGGSEWKNISNGNEQVIADIDILKLSEVIVTIENLYNFPQDIEWAEENENIYIVQSRPITTLINNI